jgi:hypothetical protein
MHQRERHAATMLSNLNVDQLVSLRNPAKSSETLEKHARIRYVEADAYQFELLLFNEEQAATLRGGT